MIKCALPEDSGRLVPTPPPSLFTEPAWGFSFHARLFNFFFYLTLFLFRKSYFLNIVEFIFYNCITSLYICDGMDIGYWAGRVCAGKYGLKRATLDAHAHSASQPLVLGSETQPLDGARKQELSNSRKSTNFGL